MKGKLLFAAGLGIGFVLGARAGRGAYDRLKSRAEDVWTDPKVQKGIHDAEEFVKDRAPVVGEKLKDATVSATAAVRDRVSGDSGAGDRARDARDSLSDAADSAKDAASTAVDSAKNKAADVADSAKDTAADVADSAKDTAAGVKDSLNEDRSDGNR